MGIVGEVTATPENIRVLLDSRPEGFPSAGNFRVDAAPLPVPGDGEVLLRTIYLSLDPYMRGRMLAAASYASSVPIGGVMEGGTVSEVVESRDASLAPGDIVLSHVGWQSYGVQPAADLRRLDPSLAPISTALGVLGMPGFTAYAGLLEIGRPQAGETVVVAAAAGPVGSTVGQIARLKGARAVGIAGGPEKVAYLRELGFDAALDHRSPTFEAELAAAAPDGIDVYFENVGGRVWDAVLPLLNTYARVPICGIISRYSQTEPADGPDRSAQLMQTFLAKRMTLRGFLQAEFVNSHHEQFQRDVAAWVANGDIHFREDVVDGIENAPDAFIGLLKGESRGKVLVRVGADPTA